MQQTLPRSRRWEQHVHVHGPAGNDLPSLSSVPPYEQCLGALEGPFHFAHRVCGQEQEGFPSAGEMQPREQGAPWWGDVLHAKGGVSQSRGTPALSAGDVCLLVEGGWQRTSQNCISLISTSS